MGEKGKAVLPPILNDERFSANLLDVQFYESLSEKYWTVPSEAIAAPMRDKATA